jgi:ABC-type nitrate/sulfonate/bicarbonate transport system ATPase subunit
MRKTETGAPVAELSINGLCRSFHNAAAEIPAVQDFSLSIASGSFTVIVGPSGCGKTTLLRLIAGLEKPDAGEIIFSEKPRFGFMFQDARLLPWLTVEGNLRLAFPPKSENPEADIGKVLKMVGLADWKNAYPRSLSGGMAQRVALARALCRRPKILLLDEPLGALDAMTRTKLRRELDDLWKSLGITVILVSHDIEEAVFLADRIVLMRDGKIEGETEVRLPRPRERHSAEFQEICRKIEGACMEQGGSAAHFPRASP